MSSTLTAGDILGSYQGYWSGVGGSLSPDSFGGFTCSILITGGLPNTISASFVGDATAYLSGKAIVVNGVTYSTVTNAPTYDSGSNTTSVSWAYAPGNFNTTPGSNEYTIDIGAGGPASPNITSPSTVPNLIGTKLAHTVTIDKTAASMAITGGADSADFEVTGTTGLRFVGDALSDTAGDLVVEVTVTDTDGLTATQTITVPIKYILYVGGKTWSRAGATSTTNVSLTDLTGGIASAPAEHDYVVVMQGIGSNADRAVATTSGYTELADIYANGTTYDANLGVDAKFMGSTPDTTVTIGSSGSANDAQAARIMVFRGVDLTTPMDVAVVTATGTGTAKPNPGAITPITTGSVGVFSGAQAAATAAALTSSDLTAFASVNQADTNDIAVGAGYIEWSGSGAMDPAVFGGGSNNSANSWAAVSIALRPAYTSGGAASVAPANAAHPHTASSPTLSAKSSVTPNSAAHSQTATSPSLAAQATISPDGASHGQSATSPTLAAQSSVAPDDAAHATTSTSPTVGVPVAISPDSAISAHTTSSPAIATNSSIAPDDSAHAHTASGPSLSVSSTVAPNDAHHASIASIPTIQTSGAVNVDSTVHAQIATESLVSAKSFVSVADAVHNQNVTSPNLSGPLTISPMAAFHGHMAEQPIIIWRGMIAANDAAHDMASSLPVIASRANIYPAPANDAHISTSPVLSAASSINVNSTHHTHRASSSSIRITMLPSSIRTIVTTMQSRTANDSRGSRSASYDVHDRIETTAVNSRTAVSVRSAQ